MLERLDHVLFVVEDLTSATRAMASLLGRSAAWAGTHPGEGSSNALFRLDNTLLELITPEGEGETGDALRAVLAARGEGLLGLAFGTSDASAAHAHFAQAGLQPGDPLKGSGQDPQTGATREWVRVPLPLERTRGVLLFAIERSAEGGLAQSASLGGESAVAFAVDHAVVRTEDADSARTLYRDGLGLRLALDKQFPQWGAHLMFFRVGGLTIEVAAALEEGKGIGPPGLMTPDMDELWGMTYRVSDADVARERLAGAGFDVSAVRKGRKPGTRVFTVRNAPMAIPTLMLEPASE